jgi:small subunit ribosomal protein S6
MYHREYETIVILHPDTMEDGVHRFNHRVKETLESHGGVLLKVDNWGKRKLAYEVKKESKGIYVYYLYLGDTSLVQELERTLRLSDTCLRYQSVKLADKVELAHRTVEESASIDFLAAADAAAKALAEAAARGETPAAEEEEAPAEMVPASPEEEAEEDLDDVPAEGRA